MSQAPFAATITPPGQAAAALAGPGPPGLDPRGFAVLISSTLAEVDAWRPSWNDLPADAYMRDGGHYRRRRHSCFVVRGDSVETVPHRAHWQPLENNALHGGLGRWLEPIEPAVVASPAWQRTLKAMGG